MDLSDSGQSQLTDSYERDILLSGSKKNGIFCFPVPKRAGKFYSSSANIDFLKTLFHKVGYAP
jgi:hypothetical protein